MQAKEKVIGQEPGQSQADKDKANEGIADLLRENTGIELLSPEELIDHDYNCSHCEKYLSELEKQIYGDSCTFCTDSIIKYPIWKSIYQAYLDWRIYNLTIKFRYKFGESAYYYFIGALGTTGTKHTKALIKIKQKKEFIEEAKYILRKNKGDK